MQLRFLPWLFLCAIFATVSLRAQPTTSVTGGAELILVAKVTGDVRKSLDGQSVALRNGDKVEQRAKVNTANNASVVLAFSNGATLRLEQDSELVIEEYLQDPFTSAVKVSEMKKEPSKSRTRLGLNRGELVGDVKPLDHAGGSSFTVQTPVGAAGIRGTIFRIVFRPNGTGQAFFTLSTAVGNVAFTQGTEGGAAQTPGAAATAQGVAGVPVPQGQEIMITVDVTQNAQGQLVVTAPPTVTGSSNITAGNNAVALETAGAIALAVQQTVFTPAASGGATAGSITGLNFSGRVDPVTTPPPPPPPTEPRIIPTDAGR